MTISRDILYIILSFFDITVYENVTLIKLLLNIELPECLLSTDVTHVK